MKEINHITPQKEKEKSTGIRVSVSEMKSQKRQLSKLNKNEAKQTQRYKNKSEFGKMINQGSN